LLLIIPAVMFFCWWMYRLLFERPKTDIRFAQPRATKVTVMNLPTSYVSRNSKGNTTFRESPQAIAWDGAHVEFGDGTSDGGHRGKRSSWEAPSSESFGTGGGNEGPEVALIVRDDPLEKILSGHKTWEMRKTNTHKRGRIALVKKGTGKIYGVADIMDSTGPLSDETMARTTHLHGIPGGHPNCSTYGQSNCPTWPPAFDALNPVRC
jgi:hypothetical protein